MEDVSNLRIIVIDDNPAIHQDFIKILTTHTSTSLDELSTQMFGKKIEASRLPQFEIDTASQGKEGVERIKIASQQGRPYSLAFVDIRMPPGWDGIETIKHIWEIDKDMQIVICTAYSDYSWEETIEHLGKTDNLLILKKPFDNVSVRQLACALTRKWQLIQDARKYTVKLEQEIKDRTLSLQKSLSLVKATFESTSDAILVINNEGTIIDYNQKFPDMLEIPREILNTKSEQVLLEYIEKNLQNPESFFNLFKQTQTNSEEILIDIIKFKNNKTFECYVQPHILNGQTIGRVLDFRDISARIKFEGELQYLATHDALTGLPNRIELMEKMRFAIKMSEHLKTKFAILFLDLDRFKLVNDSLSHAVGDNLLQNAAQRLQTCIRSEDTLSRLGGDEFVIVLMNIEEEQLKPKLQQILNVFKAPFHLSDRHVTVTSSIGVSVYPKDGVTVDVLLRNADAAMYQAKALKGNGYQFYSLEMNSQSLAELDHEMQLRQAIENHEFFLVYQPQVDVASENLVAVEALIRWQHPQKGVLLPMDFIPLAEETGLISIIGEWVMRAACAQNKAWQEAGFKNIRVAVNVTAEQFRQHNLVAMVRNILAETKLDPQFLELELTENVILSNLSIMQEISEIKKLGVSIAIDDFGTGYSSLSYLKKLPLDRLKIDSSFVQHVKSATDDEVIIRAVIAMAKSLNLEVLAEGVETQDQLNFLKKYECGDVQGFYFSKPLTKKDLEEYFKNPHKMKTTILHE